MALSSDDLGNTWDLLSDGCLKLLTVAVSLTSLAGSATVHLVGAVSALARFPGFPGFPVLL